MYSPQPYPSGSRPVPSILALPASAGSNSICHMTGISRPSYSVPDIAVNMMGDHRSSSQKPSSSSSALAMFLGVFHDGIEGISSLVFEGLTTRSAAGAAEEPMNSEKP